MDEKEFGRKLGARLKELRKRKGLTAGELGEAIGKSPDTVYSYEEGSRAVPLQTLLTLAEIYGESLDDMLASRVTANRPKAISLDVVEGNEIRKIVIDSERDDLILCRTGEWEVRYYVKCADVRLGKEMLALVRGEPRRVAISHDQERGLYSVFDIESMATELYRPQAFRKSVAVLGDYAGTISQQIRVGTVL